MLSGSVSVIPVTSIGFVHPSQFISSLKRLSSAISAHARLTKSHTPRSFTPKLGPKPTRWADYGHAPATRGPEWLILAPAEGFQACPVSPARFSARGKPILGDSGGRGAPLREVP